MVFTDPPYNINYTGTKNKKWNGLKNDNLSAEDFIDFLYKAFTNYNAFSKSGAAAYICHADKSNYLFRQAFLKSGYEWRATLIRVKNSAAYNMAQYRYKHEPIFYLYKKGQSAAWYGDHMQTTVWEAKKESGEHPTIKPVDLIVRALVNSSKSDNIVTDFFGGSGSTLIACEKVSRKCCMIEIDSHYCDVIVKRWEDYTKKKARLDGKNRTKTKTDKTKAS